MFEFQEIMFMLGWEMNSALTHSCPLSINTMKFGGNDLI